MRLFHRPSVYLLMGLVFTAACSGSPTQPSPTPTPSIAGQWTGTYRVTSCVETAPVGACSGIAGGGPHALTPSQSGANFTGQLGIGVFSVPVSGSVDTAGVVTLAGTGPISFATLTVNSWRAVLTGGTTMTGQMQYTVVAEGVIVTVSGTTFLTR